MLAESKKLLSVVVPVYFEQECIDAFFQEVPPILDKLQLRWEVVFVDDGSTDKTVAIIKEKILRKPQFKLIELSYNHGKPLALTAGIFYARGDYVLTMDPDLQDPPNEIAKFVEKIEEGYDLVFGVRDIRKDSLLNNLYSKFFWWMFNSTTKHKLPVGLSVMRIFSRRFADKFNQYPEQNRFIEGMFGHIGLKQTCIQISHQERKQGKSKFNFSRKLGLAFDALFDYSDLPLRVASKVGIVLTVLGFVSILGIISVKIFMDKFQAGWPSVMALLIATLGIQLTFLGLVGAYIGRIYRETKNRPLFSVKEITN